MNYLQSSHRQWSPFHFSHLRNNSNCTTIKGAKSQRRKVLEQDHQSLARRIQLVHIAVAHLRRVIVDAAISHGKISLFLLSLWPSSPDDFLLYPARPERAYLLTNLRDNRRIYSLTPITRLDRIISFIFQWKREVQQNSGVTAGWHTPAWCIPPTTLSCTVTPPLVDTSLGPTR